jgi:two-component sensor histidine kinase/PAS domain-containing protein
MTGGRFTARLSRAPDLRDYACALGLASIALLSRAVVDAVAPGGAHFVILLPAVALAGVFCGTPPAIAAAVAGGVTFALVFLGRGLLAWPPFAGSQIDTLMFVLACATIVWATSALRRAAASAAMAEARLAEVFRQIPGAAAILEAPEGNLLLRSTQSDSVLGQGERRMTRSGDIAAYGGLRPDGTRLEADDYPIVRALKTGEVVRGEELRYRRPDGSVVDLEVHAGAVRDAQGTIVAAVGMAFDVSQRLEAERRMRDSEALHRAAAQRLRAALDAGALGLWEVDLRTHHVSLDAAFAAMLGLPHEPIDLPRTEMLSFAHPADHARTAEVFDGAVATGGDHADELRMVTVRKATRWFVIRGAVLADMHKVVGVVSDVTERRTREDALQAALTARDMLMREADHRIKNSLQLVVALLRLQVGVVSDADAKAALHAAIARVEAIGDAHRALQQTPDLRSIELDQMLTELCRRVGALNPAVAIRCDADVGVWLDAERAIPLGLIASEVLTNALRHAFPAGAAGAVCLTLRAEHCGLQMVVADDGVGLPATPLRRGLGTTVITALTRQIGAEAATQSAPGQGTRVTIRMKLPAAATDADAQTDRVDVVDASMVAQRHD